MDNSEKKKIKIKIANNVFTVLSSDDDNYTAATAEKVDKQIKEICRTARTSVTGAAILSALNYCDDLQSLERDTYTLKKQLSSYLDEIMAQKAEIEKLTGENARLRTDIETYRRRLKEENSSASSGEPVSTPIKPVRRELSAADSEEAAEDDTETAGSADD